MRVVLIVSLNIYSVMSLDPYEEPKSSIPQKCLVTPNYLYRNCCVFPPFFTSAIADKCGSRTEILTENSAHNVTSYLRKAHDSCAHWTCVLKEHRLLTENGYLDDEKYFKHLDNWVDLNPIFEGALVEARISCKELMRPFLPLKPCEFFRLHGCIRNYVNLICPVTLPTTECNQLKDFFKECIVLNYV